MTDYFHWIIFAFHFTAALVITFGVWLRCDPDVWVSRMRVDSYKVQVNSSGLWWDGRDEKTIYKCSVPNATQTRECFNLDLPLYEVQSQNLGWHLFVLLGHFEWISAAFAFFYIKYAWDAKSWIVSSVLALFGTLIFMPFRGTLYVNEVVLLWINLVVTWSVFRNYRSIHEKQNSASSRNLPEAPSDILARFRLNGDGTLEPTKLLDAQLPALRFCEYCITASELWVAVLCVFVQDPPAFMTLGGYTLILLTNLYGLLLHYSLISDNMKVYLQAPQNVFVHSSVPSPLYMTGKGRELRIPYSMLGVNPPFQDAFKSMLQRKVWGSYIASNTSTLLNSWLAYLVAIALIFYQQTFLFSSEPPFFVVFAGWSLIFSYSTFGIWMTVVYWYPNFVQKLCFFTKQKELYAIAVYGLDVLSLASKLSIVGSLSYGFVFREEGRC
jgi:hypothetical protein